VKATNKFFNDGSPGAWRPPGFPNHDPEQVPTPVGVPCLYCGVPIQANDNGIMMEHIAETIEEHPWHIQCLRKSLGVEGAQA
jgi:hypothetical protein